MQIEYALQAVNLGEHLRFGVKAKNGVVIATEKKLPTCLIDESTVCRRSCCSQSRSASSTGMGPHLRRLIAKGRKAAQAYYRVCTARPSR